WQDRLKRRPVLTGAFLRPSYFNGPLPRMKPQPQHITLMIKRRRIARERRGEKNVLLHDWHEDLVLEGKFEKSLSMATRTDEHDFDDVFRNRDFVEEIKEQRRLIRQSFALEMDRATKPYSDEMLQQIKEARVEKIRNKTRELERERRGEVLRRTIVRRRKRPPAPILNVMTREQKRIDRAVRSVSEVGYVAQMKMKKGITMKGPDAWKVEMGRDEDQVELGSMEDEIRRINERRRQGTDDT
ncbi:hypothetical protein BD410DRAFT_730238, partial [Rickenella mellea]